MLSICIPVYNYDCHKLISDLTLQIKALEINAEIVVIDDGSSKYYLSDQFDKTVVSIVRLPQNRGRAKVRNLFCHYAKYQNLLFLDCDTEIINQDYLQKYADEISKAFQVIGGGTVYQDIAPGPEKNLHWRYCKIKENKFHKKPSVNTSGFFMTNNFIIKKEVLEKIRFNEDIENYGHEDTLFGFELQQNGIGTKYISNPVLHIDLDLNAVFLEKTTQSILNLLHILSLTQNDKAFIEHVALLKSFFLLKKSGMIVLIKPFENLFLKISRQYLEKGVMRISVFSLYKLILFSKYYSSRQ